MTALACRQRTVLADPQLVLFDKDGTLVDIHHYWASMIRLRAERLCEVFFPRRADADDAKALIASAMGLDQKLGRIRPEGPVGVKPRPFNVEITRSALLQLGVETTPQRVEAVFKEVDDLTAADLLPLTRALPGAVDLLEALDRRGVPMGIVTTDLTQRAAAAMEALGLARYFRFVIGGDAVANTKPAPDLVEMALRKGPFARERTVVIGDHPVDILMGRAARVGATVGVLTGLSRDEAFSSMGCDVVPDLTFLHAEG